MLMDKKTTIENLIEKGKVTGKLSTKEITDALEELDDVQNVYHNVELPDDEE